MELIGYAASLLIGLSLGLLGSGGSILTLPVLVYLFQVDPQVGTAYSLVIVGATALVGVVPKALKKEVDFGTALLFGAPSIAAVYLTRAYLLPALPDHWGPLTKSQGLMVLFAVLMVLAARGMLRDKSKAPSNRPSLSPWAKAGIVLGEGAGVGVLTGLVGAGGGFLIIPVLVLVTGLEMKRAVGTSLLIIAAKSLIGFTGDLDHLDPDWYFLLRVTLVALVGLAVGTFVAQKIPAKHLQKAFGYFVLVMGAFVMIKELAFP
jgi:uncharacterized membrane protein YfcA